MIRYGVMCNGTTFPAWEAQCLQKLLAIQQARLSLLIFDGDTSHAERIRSRIGTLTELRSFAWNLLFLWSHRSPAMRPVSLAREMATVPSVVCRVDTRGKFSQYFKDAEIDRIRQSRLDFIIRFGFNIIRGDILNAARFGVWSFHHGDEQKYRGGPPGFWEIYHDDRQTAAVLQRLTHRLDGGIVLRKEHFDTIDSSCLRNRDGAYLRSVDWPAAVCLDLLNGNTAYLDAAPSKTTARVFSSPTNAKMVAFLIKLARNRARARFRG